MPLSQANKPPKKECSYRTTQRARKHALLYGANTVKLVKSSAGSQSVKVYIRNEPGIGRDITAAAKPMTIVRPELFTLT